MALNNSHACSLSTLTCCKCFQFLPFQDFKQVPMLGDTNVHRWVVSSLNLCLCINWKLMSIPLFTKHYFILFEFTFLLKRFLLWIEGVEMFSESHFEHNNRQLHEVLLLQDPICKGKASIAFAPTPTYCTCACNPNRTGQSSDDWFSTDTAPLHPHSQGLLLLLLLLNLKAPFYTINHASLGFWP